ncbi:MAG: aldo/keto reductase [Pseudomonadota bacterium]
MKINRREFTKAGLGAATLATLGTPAFAGPEHMIKGVIPKTGEKLPIIGLGTNRYGVGTSPEERAPLKAALAKFHALGGTVIDTAPMYRTSESVLGDLIAELGIHDDLFIATKADKKDGGDATDAQMQESLRKLKTDSFDLMQVHNLIGWRAALPVMREWKDAGKIRYVGITTSRSDQYGDFENVMREQELDFIQINYSLGQREAADRILPLAADKGIAVIVNRAFYAGRLFKAVADQSLPEWVNDFGCDSWAQFFLKYAIGHPAATLSIPGMTKLRHVEDNWRAGHGRLPNATERTRMEAFFDAL